MAQPEPFADNSITTSQSSNTGCRDCQPGKTRNTPLPTTYIAGIRYQKSITSEDVRRHVSAKLPVCLCCLSRQICMSIDRHKWHKINKWHFSNIWSSVSLKPEIFYGVPGFLLSTGRYLRWRCLSRGESAVIRHLWLPGVQVMVIYLFFSSHLSLLSSPFFLFRSY